VQKVVEDLRAAEDKRAVVDPALPQKLLFERLQLEQQYREADDRRSDLGGRPAPLDLIEMGLAAVTALLRK